MVGDVARRVWPRVEQPGGEVAEAARRQDWPAVRDLLLAVPEGEWEPLLRGLGDGEGVREWLAEVIEKEPEPALALLVSASCHIHWAWEARTDTLATYVSAEQFRLFHERLRIAEEQLYEVAEREPAWAEPWHLLLITGRGLEVGPTPAYERFEAVVRRQPEHLGAHLQYLQQVAAKWGGSEEEMHHFAWTAMTGARPGSPLGVLVAVAHIESMLDRGGRPSHYFGQPTVRRALREAADRSVCHPDHRRGPDWAFEYNAFAMVFALGGETRAARQLFRALGGRVTESPWRYLSVGAVPAYRRWRHRCGVWF